MNYYMPTIFFIASAWSSYSNWNLKSHKWEQNGTVPYPSLLFKNNRSTSIFSVKNVVSSASMKTSKFNHKHLDHTSSHLTSEWLWWLQWSIGSRGIDRSNDQTLFFKKYCLPLYSYCTTSAWREIRTLNSFKVEWSTYILSEIHVRSSNIGNSMIQLSIQSSVKKTEFLQKNEILEQKVFICEEIQQ